MMGQGFKSKLRDPVSGSAGGFGEFLWSGDPAHPGVRLSYDDRLAHIAGIYLNERVT
jgi:hypothetical protein